MYGAYTVLVLYVLQRVRLNYICTVWHASSLRAPVRNVSIIIGGWSPQIGTLRSAALVY
jgi:hypothetical protein